MSVGAAYIVSTPSNHKWQGIQTWAFYKRIPTYHINAAPDGL